MRGGFNMKRAKRRLPQERAIMTLLNENVGRVFAGLLSDLPQQDMAEFQRVFEEHRQALVRALYYTGKYAIDFTWSGSEPPSDNWLAQFVFVTKRDGTIIVGARPKTPAGEWVEEGRMREFPPHKPYR